MELIDTHCHLTFDDLAQDTKGVIERSRQASVTGWITVGTDMRENQKAIEFANRFENLYAAVAVHPHDAKTVTDNAITELKELAQNKKVVAIGETGLDYYYDNSTPDDQQRVFAQHLKIAAELNLPVIIHSRKAFGETVEILDEHGRDVKKVVFHCFSGSAEQAQILIPKGYFFSFTGVVTFKNAEKTRNAAAVVPVDRLMLETDCPYMSPEPVRKQKVNEPAMMVHTAKFLAELRGMTLEDFAAITTGTAREFFNLPSPFSS